MADQPSRQRPRVSVPWEHHNYFVGQGHVLSHDFNEPLPTILRVPGLAPVAAR